MKRGWVNRYWFANPHIANEIFVFSMSIRSLQNAVGRATAWVWVRQLPGAAKFLPKLLTKLRANSCRGKLWLLSIDLITKLIHLLVHILAHDRKSFLIRYWWTRCFMLLTGGATCTSLPFGRVAELGTVTFSSVAFLVEGTIRLERRWVTITDGIRQIVRGDHFVWLDRGIQRGSCVTAGGWWRNQRWVWPSWPHFTIFISYGSHSQAFNHILPIICMTISAADALRILGIMLPIWTFSDGIILS